jgi:hypothetical protein
MKNLQMVVFYYILVGGDWNHGILLLSHHIGNRKIIPTDELHHSSAG